MELLTIREVAQITKLSATTIRRRIASGELKAVRVGKGVRVPKAAVQRFIKPVHPTSVKRPSVPRGKPTSADDPLWNLVGIGHSGGPGDVSANKHRYLADACLPHHKPA